VKLALALALCALTPWIAARAPGSESPAVRARVLDARTLQLEQDGRQSVLTLTELPEGARLQAAEAERLLESGTVVALVVQVGPGFEYRYLCRREAGGWGARQVAGEPQASDGWWLSAPLFAEPGDAYRIVEVHSSGSDAFELTFRRGWPSVHGDEVRLDEVIVADPCPGRPPGGGLPSWVHVIRAEGRRL
jgi:hypothetical protein